MNSKRRIAYIVSLTLSLVVLGSCAGGVVSKRDYMSRVYEREKLAEQLAALQSEHARLKGEKEARHKEHAGLKEEVEKLSEQLAALQSEHARLKGEKEAIHRQVMAIAQLPKQQLDTRLKVKSSSKRIQPSGYYAVIIGISEYKYLDRSGIPNLIYADDDAKDFSRALMDLGWSDSHIKLLINEQATQRNIIIGLESWLTKAGANDVIVLFWSGHGFPDPEDPEKVYFVCYDTDLRIPATGYRMDRVRITLEERGARNVVILADTCHAGKLITRGEKGISIVPHIQKMRREHNIPKGWVFMVGADADRQAIEHTSWANGAFTHCLLKGLSGDADGYESIGDKDGVVTMGELRAYLNSAMPDETQKVLGVAKRPVITTSSGDPSIWKLNLQSK